MLSRVLAAVLVLVTTLAVPASAQDVRRGVSVDLAAIDVAEPMMPGGSYRLPPLRVRNPGSAPTGYSMTPRPGGDGLEPHADWLAFSPHSFELAPGEEQVVDVEIVVPPAAGDGAYSALLAAQVVDPSASTDESTAHVGAAVATRLHFQVAPASWWAGWTNALRRWWAAHSPWSWLALAALMLTSTIWWLSRRYEIRLQRIPS